MRYLDHARLTEIFCSGRFKKEPTLVVDTITENDEGGPVLAIFTDKPNGKKLGACTASEIEVVLSFAQEKKEQGKINPNFIELQRAFADIEKFTGQVMDINQRTAEKEKRKVVSFFTREPV